MELIKEDNYNSLLDSSFDKELLCTCKSKDVLSDGQTQVYYVLLDKTEKDLSNIEIYRKLGEMIHANMGSCEITRYVIIKKPSEATEG